MAIQSEINTKIKCHSYLNKQNDMNIHVNIDKKKKAILDFQKLKKTHLNSVLAEVHQIVM